MRPFAPLALALAGLFAAGPALAQTPTQTLSGVISSNRTLDAGQVYLIDGEVYVDNGVTLTIPAGTILKGRQTPSAGNGVASVLVVQRGARLVASGTAAQPIIFTAEADDVTDPFDTNESQRGLWGGVVILGNATNNRGVRNIEGIPATDRTAYGCGDAFPCDDDDDSGVLRYVSVRHAGFTLTANAEINGITFGGVGRNTVVEYVEVFANSDDSFEFFGGTVNARYLVGAYGGDDDIDWDTGYTGNIQFFLSVKDESGDVGRCIEGDGAASPFTAVPLSRPVVSNLTCIGSGVGSAPGGSDAGGPTLFLTENTQGFLYNSVFQSAQTPRGAIVLEAPADPLVSTRVNFDEGELDIRNNLFWDFSTGNTAAGLSPEGDAALQSAIAGRNTIGNPGLLSVSRQQDRLLDPRPAPGAAAASGADFALAGLSNPFFTPVSFRGAFGPGGPGWAAGWSAISTMNYLSEAFVPTESGPDAARLAVAVGPNPAGATATVRLTLAAAGDARVAVYDVLGREVAVLLDGPAADAPALRLDTRSLPAGVYVVRASADGAVATATLTVVR